jgi:hypothetical protein
MQNPTPCFREAGSGPGFHVLAADSYGAGKSPAWPTDRPVSLQDEVALLEPVFARAGPDSPSSRTMRRAMPLQPIGSSKVRTSKRAIAKPPVRATFRGLRPMELARCSSPGLSWPGRRCGPSKRSGPRSGRRFAASALTAHRACSRLEASLRIASFHGGAFHSGCCFQIAFKALTHFK